MGAFRFHVRGRVQGVGYRYFVLQEAERRNVTGFTRNLADGSVEVIADLPRSGPTKLEAGRRALAMAREATRRALDQPIAAGVVTV